MFLCVKEIKNACVGDVGYWQVENIHGLVFSIPQYFCALSSVFQVWLVAFLGKNIPNTGAYIFISLVLIMKARNLSSINSFLQCFPLKFFDNFFPTQSRLQIKKKTNRFGKWLLKEGISHTPALFHFHLFFFKCNNLLPRFFPSNH